MWTADELRALARRVSRMDNRLLSPATWVDVAMPRLSRPQFGALARCLDELIGGPHGHDLYHMSVPVRGDELALHLLFAAEMVEDETEWAPALGRKWRRR